MEQLALSYLQLLHPLVCSIRIRFVVVRKEMVQKGIVVPAPVWQDESDQLFPQSIIGCGLFAYYGFNLQTKLGITYAFFVGIAMVVVQCLFSNLWLKYHSHGPFEGIWKKLTWIKF